MQIRDLLKIQAIAGPVTTLVKGVAEARGGRAIVHKQSQGKGSQTSGVIEEPNVHLLN